VRYIKTIFRRIPLWVFLFVFAASAPAQVLKTASYCPTYTVYTGIATWYSGLNEIPGTGNCGFPVGQYDPNLYVAVNSYDYEHGAVCGSCIAAHYGAKSVTVMAVDQCPGSCALHQLDLSPQAFLQLAATQLGQIDITAILCVLELRTLNNHGNISYQFKDGCTLGTTHPVQMAFSRSPRTRSATLPGLSTASRWCNPWRATRTIGARPPTTATWAWAHSVHLTDYRVIP
jgi:hypothetical protein